MAQTLEAVFYQGNQSRIDHVPGSDVANGEIIHLGSNLVGICTDPEGIDSGKTGSLAVDGIFKLKKDGIDTFSAGDKVAWDDTADQVEPDGGANDDFTVGQAIEDAVAGDDHVKVWINHELPA